MSLLLHLITEYDDQCCPEKIPWSSHKPLEHATIEGLHDAVRTHTRTIFPRSLVSFLYGMVGRKTIKPAVTFDLLYSKI